MYGSVRFIFMKRRIVSSMTLSCHFSPPNDWMPKMKKMLTLLAIPLAQAAMVSAFAQAPAATSPSASPSRAEVKAGASAANADQVNQFQDKPGAATAGSGTTRAEVKAERNASGNMSRGNTEVPTPGSSSQPNLKNGNPMTAEQRAARREARRQHAAERKAHRATTAKTGVPANGGAGGGNPAPGK
jgi:hypothetical protein